MFLASLYGSFVGVTLGLTGGGGSIFAVTLLVYGLGLSFRQSVPVSLAVVGVTALLGALLQFQRGETLWRTGALMGLGGVALTPIGSFVGAKLPERLTLLLFAALMTVIAIRMLSAKRAQENTVDSISASQASSRADRQMPRSVALKLLGAGSGVGFLSGLFGVGGGFLLVPAILLVTKATIEQAMGTSLVAIFLIAASGVAANLRVLLATDHSVTTWFLGGSGLGIVLGSYAKPLLPSHVLSKLFGILVLISAVYVTAKNLWPHSPSE